jgi:hypothetical protein
MKLLRIIASWRKRFSISSPRRYQMHLKKGVTYDSKRATLLLEIFAADGSTVYAYKNVIVWAADGATVHAYPGSVVHASPRSLIFSYGKEGAESLPQPPSTH